METKKEATNMIVLDTNVFIKMINVREKYDATFYTVPEVLAEIKDEKVNSWMSIHRLEISPLIYHTN